MTQVKLLRPLDGRVEGDTAEYPEADAKRLADGGVVEILGAKAAHAPENKMDLAPENKDVRRAKKVS